MLKRSSFKRTAVILFIVLLALAPTNAEEPGTFDLNMLASWAPGLSFGFEYQITQYVGVAASLGTCVMLYQDAVLYLGNAKLMLYPDLDDAGLRPSIHLGLLEIKAGFGEKPYLLLSFGIAVGADIPIGKRLGFLLRGGFGYPFFRVDGEWSAGSLFPLGIWPDVALGLRLRLGKVDA
ncbi:MAG: hypothetical protein JW923_11015 [Spirochaetales bacterium]|nr:hypothetical protein [Spirochaetales bacterium]